MMKTEHLGGAMWRVSEVEDRQTGDGPVETVLWSRKVATKAGGTEADAIALAQEAQTPTPPTEEQVAAWQAESRAQAVKAETTRRIDAVASPYARENMIGAAAAGTLSAEQQAAYVASVQWIAAMRAACQALIALASADFNDDANWPAVSPEVAALASAF